MKELHVTTAEQGQRLNKYLGRVLREAPQSFLYKMLRKKNITLNGARADGSELLRAGDRVCFFLSDDTFEKFAGAQPKNEAPRFAETALAPYHIRYEDPEVLIAYKPAGLLSQKDKSGREAINERILQYLADSGQLTAESLRRFKPSVCNRLDRNTSGLILFAKTLAAQQQIGRCLRERTLKKYYLCIVSGRMDEPFWHEGFLRKDTERNLVTVETNAAVGEETAAEATAERIVTSGAPLAAHEELTLLRVELHTGKSHQIRAVLEALSHPILGDPKYRGGAEETRRRMRRLEERYGLRSQLLVAYELGFPEMTGSLRALSGKRFFSPLPADFRRVLTEEFPEAAPRLLQGGTQ